MGKTQPVAGGFNLFALTVRLKEDGAVKMSSEAAAGIEQKQVSFFATSTLKLGVFAGRNRLLCTVDSLYTRQLMHHIVYTPDSLYTRQFIHQTAYAPYSLYTRQFIH